MPETFEHKNETNIEPPEHKPRIGLRAVEPALASVNPIVNSPVSLKRSSRRRTCKLIGLILLLSAVLTGAAALYFLELGASDTSAFERVETLLKDAGDAPRSADIGALETMAHEIAVTEGAGDIEAGLMAVAALARCLAQGHGTGLAACHRVRTQYGDSPLTAFLRTENISAPCARCGGEGSLSQACPICKGSGRCRACKGSGTVTASSGNKEARAQPCHVCEGSGTCATCQGTGTMVFPCPHCNQTGRVLSDERTQKTLDQAVSKTRSLVAGRMRTAKVLRALTAAQAWLHTLVKEKARENLPRSTERL